MDRYCLHIPADLHISPAVRAIAVNVFERCGFSGTMLAHLKVVFDEIYMNAVKYGSAPDSTVCITIEFAAEKLAVSCEDEGAGAKKVSASEINEIISFQKKNTDPAKTSGRGLAQIASKWADELKVTDSKRGGICICFTKNLKSNDRPDTEQELSIVNPTTDLSKLSPTVIALQGEIDNLSLPEKAKEVEAFLQQKKTGALLVLDFRELLYCTSSFIAKVALWKRQMNEQGGEMVIQNIPANILEIFDLVGLTKILTISTDQLYEPIQSTQK